MAACHGNTKTPPRTLKETNSADNTEEREAAVERAQEQVYETAHDLVMAATDGDAPGVEALLKGLNIRLQTILNKGPLPWTDTA